MSPSGMTREPRSRLPFGQAVKALAQQRNDGVVSCRVLIDNQFYGVHGFGFGTMVPGGLQGMAQRIGDVL